MKDKKQVTILMVEDDLIDQMTIERGFAKLKIANNLIVAKDGIEALEILRGQNGKQKLEKPFIILLDLNLPRMSGLEFLEVLRNDSDLKSTVVFILTTSNLDHDLSKAYNMNIAGYILKSNAGEGFVNAIKMIDHFWKIVELP